MAQPTEHIVERQTVTLAQEELNVEKREVITGEVVVHKTVVTEPTTVELATTTHGYTEQRVPIGREVDQIPATRYEGDTIIIPVVREEIVTVKRLILAEEVHLRPETKTETRQEVVDLRREEVSIERR